jgi:hypothetical protein
MHAKAPLSFFLISLLLSNLAMAEQQDDSKLRIVVISGQGSINNIHSRTNVTPVVEVEDQNRKPLPGVPVVFYLPNQGPGGVFSNSSTTLTATTDNHGRAAASGIRFNNQTGSFDIRVTANYQGETATTTITQTDVTGTSSSGSGGGGGGGLGTRAWVILGICGAAVAAGVLLATRGSSTKAGPPPIVITPGTPTVGAPQ